MKIFRMIALISMTAALMAACVAAQEVPAISTDALSVPNTIWTPFPDKPRVDHLVSKSNDEPAELINSGTYAFSAQSGIALEDMSSGTTPLILPGTDNANSSLAQIGFLFRFDGTFYTTFGVNGNGLLRLGGVISDPSFTNSIATITSSPKIMPYWDDLCVGNTGKVHYKMVPGPVGTQKLVIEWKNMKITRAGGCDGTGAGTFQLWLYDRTGLVQFVYGDGMTTPSSLNGGYSVGIQSGFANNFASVTTSNSTVSYTSANDVQIAPISSGSSFLLQPSIPAAVTGLTAAPGKTSVQLNWTDNANNETAYLVRRTTDNVNFYFVGNGIPSNSTTFTDTGLEPSTTYTYYVNALTEGAFGPDVSVQTTTLPAGNIVSTAAGGQWSALSTWVGGTVPGPGDNVTIASGATVIIDTAAAAFNLTVGSVDGGSPAVLRFGETAAFSLTVSHDVLIRGSDFFTTGQGNANQHVLTIYGNLSNYGTLDFSTNNNQAGAGIVFTGNSNSAYWGTGPVNDIMTLTVDKGTSYSTSLELSVSNFTVRGSTTDTSNSGYLFLNHGLFIISGTFTGNHRTFASPVYQISAATGIWLNNPNYTVTAQGSRVDVYGYFRVTSGAYNVGQTPGQPLVFFPGSTVVIEGGNVNTSGAFSDLSSGSPQSSYSQTGGTLTTCTAGAVATCYEVGGTGATATLTGGEVVLQNAGGYTWTGSALDTSSATVRFGNASSFQPSIFNSGGSLPNVVIDTSAGGHTLNLTGKLRNITIGTGGSIEVFNTVTVTGETFINNGNIGAAQSSAVLSLTGQDPVYSGAGTTSAVRYLLLQCNTFTLDSVNNLRVRTIQIRQGNIIHANKLTFGNNDASGSSVIFGDLNIPSPGGSFDSAPVFELGTGGQSLTYYRMNASRTTGPEINPSRTLSSLSYWSDNPATVRLDIGGGDITVTNLQLNFGEVNTGSNKITLLTTPTQGFGSGWVYGTLNRRFTSPGGYLFPMGQGFKLDFNLSISALAVNPSFLSVTIVDATMPGLLPAQSLSRYWILHETGDMTVSQMAFSYRADDVNGAETNYKMWRSTGGAPFLTPSFPPSVNAHQMATAAPTTDFEGSWSAGEQVDPGPVSVSGRVTNSTGNPIRNATVTISGGGLSAPVTVFTGSLGTYVFNGLQAGNTYTISASAKRYRFPPGGQQVTPFGNVANVDFAANPQEEF